MLPALRRILLQLAMGRHLFFFQLTVMYDNNLMSPAMVSDVLRQMPLNIYYSRFLPLIALPRSSLLSEIHVSRCVQSVFPCIVGRPVVNGMITEASSGICAGSFAVCSCARSYHWRMQVVSHGGCCVDGFPRLTLWITRLLDFLCSSVFFSIFGFSSLFTYFPFFSYF